MKRTFAALALAASLTGCQSVDQPAPGGAGPALPIDNQPQSYDNLLNKARDQAAAATRAFIASEWSSLEDTASSLERTADQMPKANDIPGTRKEAVSTEAVKLGREARQLRDAARTANERRITENLQQINLLVRQLPASGPGQ
jgi:hypothetical protein